LIAFRCDLRLVSVVDWCNIHDLQGLSAHAAIKLILDNHSAHPRDQGLARRSARRPLVHLHSQARLVAQPRQGFFFQARAIRPVYIHRIQTELKDRIMAAMDFFNQEPVVHTWTQARQGDLI
jgi:hypothetical protein